MSDLYELEKYSLMDVCMELHSNNTGTNPIAPDRQKDLIDWLEWRLQHGWESEGESETEKIIKELAWKIVEDSTQHNKDK